MSIVAQAGADIAYVLLKGAPSGRRSRRCGTCHSAKELHGVGLLVHVAESNNAHFRGAHTHIHEEGNDRAVAVGSRALLGRREQRLDPSLEEGLMPVSWGTLASSVSLGERV